MIPRSDGGARRPYRLSGQLLNSRGGSRGWAGPRRTERRCVGRNAAGVDLLIDRLAFAEVDPETCQLLGGFALAIQSLMGLLVLGSLLLKRAVSTACLRGVEGGRELMRALPHAEGETQA